jgi:hypothetical protein
MKQLLLAAALCSISATAFADEVVKWRHVQHTAAFQAQNIDDTKGHQLALYRLPGLAMFSDGTIGSTMVVGAADNINGSGSVNGYNTVTLSDGSVVYLKYTGTVQVTGSNTLRKGTFTVTGGTGRYAGAKGEGTWEGNGASICPDATSYVDCVVTIKK